MDAQSVVKIQYCFSKKQFSRIVSILNSSPYMNFWKVLFPALVVFGFATRRPEDLTPFVTIVIYVGFLALQRRRFHQAFESLPWKNQVQTWNIGPEELAVTCDAFQSVLKWYMLDKVSKHPDGFLLRLKSGEAYWLPLESFSTADDLQTFQGHCVSHGLANAVPPGQPGRAA